MAAVKVIFFLLALVAGILAAKDPNGHCQLKGKGGGKKVCNGAIGKDMGKFVKICLNGILKIKKKASVEPAAPQCENEEGEVFCEGDVVEEKTCNEQMGVYKEICMNGTTVKDPEPCVAGEEMFCHGDVVEEKICSEESLDTYAKSSDTYVKQCQNGSITNWQPSPESSLPPASSYCSTSPNPCPSCEADGQSFCETEVVAEKSCGAENEEKYMKKCQNGTLGWVKESVKGSPLKESCDPCPSCELDGNLYCDAEMLQEKNCGEEKYMKKCENGTLGWKKESVEGSPLKESCDPCPSCELDGNLYCDTEVVQEKNCGEGGYSQVCSSGDLVWENSDPSSSLPEPCDSPNPCPCRWYGEYFCDGDLVKDLFSWWFHMKCSNGTPRVNGRLWNEVIQDERFKP